VNIVRRLLPVLCIFLNTYGVYGQLSDGLSQKVTFQKYQITIGEALKEVIHTKKINLSYSPDALDLQETISLPAKIMTIKDVLSLIGTITGNKVIINGSQVIIKKDKKPVLNSNTFLAVTEKKETEKIMVEREAVTDTLHPKSISQTNVLESMNASLKKTPDILERYTRKKVLQTEVGKPIAKVPDRPVKKIRPLNLDKGFVLNAGGGIEVSYVSNLQDSFQTLKASPAIGWNLQTNVGFQLNANWLIETGIGFRQSNYSVNSKFRYFVYSDTITWDTVSSQHIQLKVTSLEVPFVLNCIFNVHKSKVIVGLGGSIQYGLAGKREYTNNVSSGSKNVSWNESPKPTSVLNSLTYINRVNYNFIGQVGFQRNNWKLTAAARIGVSSFSNNESGNIRQFSLTFLYQFFAKK